MRPLIYYLVHIALLAFRAAGDPSCTSEKNLVADKQETSCSHLKLTSVPLTSIPKDTGILILKFNAFKSISTSTFKDLPLLVELDVSNNDLSEIKVDYPLALEDLNLANNSFTKLPLLSSLPSLTKLDISYNHISNVDDTAFHDLKNLKELYLQHNKISQLSEQVFEELSTLETLDLSYNQLRRVPQHLIMEATNMKKLYLTGNRLTEIPDEFFEGLNLAYVYLDENPWQCNCALEYFKTWMEENEDNIYTMKSGSTTNDERSVLCSSPTGLPLLDYSMDHCKISSDVDPEDPTIFVNPSTPWVTTAKQILTTTPTTEATTEVGTTVKETTVAVTTKATVLPSTLHTSTMKEGSMMSTLKLTSIPSTRHTTTMGEKETTLVVTTKSTTLASTLYTTTEKKEIMTSTQTLTPTTAGTTMGEKETTMVVTTNMAVQASTYYTTTQKKDMMTSTIKLTPTAKTRHITTTGETETTKHIATTIKVTLPTTSDTTTKDNVEPKTTVVPTSQMELTKEQVNMTTDSVVLVTDAPVSPVGMERLTSWLGDFIVKHCCLLHMLLYLLSLFLLLLQIVAFSVCLLKAYISYKKHYHTLIEMPPSVQLTRYSLRAQKQEDEIPILQHSINGQSHFRGHVQEEAAQMLVVEVKSEDPVKKYTSAIL